MSHVPMLVHAACHTKLSLMTSQASFMQWAPLASTNLDNM
jgi:hypothetical protein